MINRDLRATVHACGLTYRKSQYDVIMVSEHLRTIIIIITTIFGVVDNEFVTWLLLIIIDTMWSDEYT